MHALWCSLKQHYSERGSRQHKTALCQSSSPEHSYTVVVYTVHCSNSLLNWKAVFILKKRGPSKEGMTYVFSVAWFYSAWMNMSKSSSALINFTTQSWSQILHGIVEHEAAFQKWTIKLQIWQGKFALLKSAHKVKSPCRTIAPVFHTVYVVEVAAEVAAAATSRESETRVEAHNMASSRSHGLALLFWPLWSSPLRWVRQLRLF